MPCWTVERTKTEFLADTTNIDVLADALRAKGYTVMVDGTTLRFSIGGKAGTYDSTTGKLDIPASWSGDRIKEYYSEEIVNSQAERFGWTVDWQTNAQGNREAKVVRRTR